MFTCFLCVLAGVTGRRVRRRTAVMGALHSPDRWVSHIVAVKDEAQVAALGRQGFDQLAVTTEEDGEAVESQELLTQLREQGVALLTATGERGGRQRARGDKWNLEFSCLPMLPHLLVHPSQGEEGSADQGS